MSSISSVSSSMSSSMLKQMQEEMFKKADANNDSSISKDEFSAMSKSEDIKSSSDAATMFAQFDTDSDGALSRLESDAAIAKAGQEMQSQGARPQGPPPGPPPSEESETSSSDSSDVSAIFDEMDTNQDGVVSLAEMTAALDSSEESESATDSKTLLDTISTALESGDTTTAQAALATLQEQAAARNGGNVNDPFNKDLQELSDALASGDTSSAQSLVAGIQEKMAAHGPQNQMAGDSQNQNADSQDTVAQTLQSMLDALEESSATSEDSVNSALQSVIASALNSYMQQSSSSYSQTTVSGTSVSTSA
jgi:Ca2+-binding EF-hand superfamily protein